MPKRKPPLYYHNKAKISSFKEMERLAKNILRKNEDLKSFVIWENKEWGFILKKNEMSIPNTLPHLKEMKSFMDKWDQIMNLTENPLVITAHSKKLF